jgi:hypothetical protein
MMSTNHFSGALKDNRLGGGGGGQASCMDTTHSPTQITASYVHPSTMSELHPMSIVHVDDRFDKFLAVPLSLGTRDT